MAGLEVRDRVVLAQAVLPGQAVASVAVAVAPTPPALAAAALLRREVAGLAPLAAKPDSVASAVDADGLVPFRMEAQKARIPPEPFRARSLNADVPVGEIVRVQDSLSEEPMLAEAVFGHAVAVLQAGHALSPVPG